MGVFKGRRLWLGLGLEGVWCMGRGGVVLSGAEEGCVRGV